MEVLTLSPLQNIYLDQYGSSQEDAVQNFVDFIKGNQPDCNLDFFDKFQKVSDNQHSIPYTKKIRDLSAFWFIAQVYPQQCLSSERLISDTAEILEILARHPEYQLGAAYSRLLAHFSGSDAPKCQPLQGKAGAAPLDTGGFWGWARLPHQSFHSELGVLWAVLGQLTQNKDLAQAAVKLADWQLNTLDTDFGPRIGLYTQEADASFNDILLWNYLLYFTVGTLNSHSRFLYAAQQLATHLEKAAAHTHIDLPHIAPLIEKWASEFKIDCAPQEFGLQQKIYEEENALVGLRNESFYVVSTLHGCNTGLGTLRCNDLEIVTYGPQHLPYGDCTAFGILNPMSLSPGNTPFLMKANNEEFFIKGNVKIPGKDVRLSPYPLFRKSEHSGMWADITQEYRDGCLNIDLLLMGYEKEGRSAFAFYVKAGHCVIQNIKTMYPKTLDRYEGKVAAIDLIGEGGKLTLQPNRFEGAMQIIPLAGGLSFWGADFLIGFTLDKTSPHYSWKIMLHNEANSKF